MKKFNLEKAIAGEPLITRDGREVEEFKYFKTVKTIIVVIDGKLYQYFINGRCICTKGDYMDLFMAPKKQKFTVLIYKPIREGGAIFAEIKSATTPSECKLLKEIEVEIEI